MLWTWGYPVPQLFHRPLRADVLVWLGAFLVGVAPVILYVALDGRGERQAWLAYLLAYLLLAVSAVFGAAWARSRFMGAMDELMVSSTGFDGGFQLPLSGLLEQGGASVLGLVLDRRDEADLAVQAPEGS